MLNSKSTQKTNKRAVGTSSTIIEGEGEKPRKIENFDKVSLNKALIT
jgi:hypothetical protein